MIKNFFYSRWTKEWEKYPGARLAKQFYSRPDSNVAKYAYKMDRLKLGRFLRLVAGHNGLNYFKSKVDPEISPLCRFCEEKDETFYHLVDNCPIFRTRSS